MALMQELNEIEQTSFIAGPSLEILKAKRTLRPQKKHGLIPL